MTLPVLRSTRWSVIFATIFLVGAAVSLIGLYMYGYGRQVMESQLKDTLRTMAALAASQIDARDLAALNVEEDWHKPEWTKVVTQLEAVRLSNPSILFVYMFRLDPTDPTKLVFVSDSQSIDPYADVDLNGDGIFDEADSLQYPGLAYEEPPPEAFLGFKGVVTNDEPYTDQWGEEITGYAPVYDEFGNAVAVLAIDMRAEEYVRLAHSIFSPILLLLVALAAALIAGYIITSISREKAAALQEVDHERSALLSLTSHQLGNPVALLNWSIDALTGTQLSDIQKDLVNKIKEGTQRLEGILKALHQADEIRSSTTRPLSEKLLLKEALDLARQQLASRMAMHGTKLEVEGLESLVVRADRKAMEAILDELISNAIDYSPENSSVRIRISQKSTFAKIEITDEGQGISAEDLPHVFEKYFRSSKAVLHKVYGNGLGLFIVKGLVERMGGQISIASRGEGQGSTVTLLVPVA